MTRTAFDRATAKIVEQYDAEIIEWAVRIRNAPRLMETWEGWPGASLRYARRLRKKHPSASHEYVLTYLRMVLHRIGERNLKPDPRLRTRLIRAIARLEQRVTQLESGL